MSGVRIIYSDLIAAALQRGGEVRKSVTLDQHQANGTYGIHQIRARVKGDPTTYRVIIAPADVPLSVGYQPIDQHFAEPIIPTCDECDAEIDLQADPFALIEPPLALASFYLCEKCRDKGAEQQAERALEESP